MKPVSEKGMTSYENVEPNVYFVPSNCTEAQINSAVALSLIHILQTVHGVKELKFLEGKAFRLKENGKELYTDLVPEMEECRYRAIPYFAWGNRGAVSYTHLDVYKRQTHPLASSTIL